MKFLNFRGILFIYFLFFFNSNLYSQNWLDLKIKAFEFYNQEEYEKAFSFFEKYLSEAEQELGEESNKFLLEVNNQGMYFLKIQEYDKALPLFLKALKIVEKVKGKNDQDYLTILENIASVYTYLENKEKTIEYNLKILEFMRMNDETETPSFGLTLNYIGVLYGSIRQYDKALPFYIEALENAEKSVGRNNLTYSIRLFNLGKCYEHQNNYESALSYYLEAKENTEKVEGKFDINHFNVISEMAELYRKMNRYDDAIIYLEEAIGIIEKLRGKYNLTYLITSSRLALIYEEIGNYSVAVSILEKVIETIENNKIFVLKEEGNLNLEAFYMATINNLSKIYSDLGQYDKALSIYLDIKDEISENFGNKSPQYLTILINLSEVYRNLGDIENALLINIEAAEMAFENSGKNSIDFLITSNNLASTYLLIGDFEMALNIYWTINEIAEKVIDENDSIKRSILNGIGLVFMRNEPVYEKAESIYLGLIEKTKRILGPNHPEYRMYIGNLAELYNIQKKYVAAAQLYLSALKNLNIQINRNFNFLSENEKESYINTILISLTNYINFFSNYYSTNQSASETLYNIELSTKGLIQSSSENVRKNIEQSNNPEIIKIYENWLLKKSSIAKQYSLPISERSENLKQLENEAENIERQLVQFSSEFGTINQIGKTTWEEVQRKLKSNEVAIEFSSFRYRNKLEWTDSVMYTALVLRKGDKQPVLIPLFEQKQLDKVFVNVGKSSKDLITQLYGNTTIENENKLYTLIWKPIEKYLKEGETIYFAPSGSLHQISFSAISTPDGHYLSDKYNLKQVSTTAKILNPEEKTNIKNVALFGGINYDESVENLALNSKSIQGKEGFVSRSLFDNPSRGEVFGFLPGTLNEVKSIKNLAEKNNINVGYYTDNDALEEQFKALNGKNSPQILHIATHGFFFPDPKINKEDLSRMQFMGEQQNVFKISDNPLNRSGLLFAGANHAWKGEKAIDGVDDGILTAYEVSNVSLPKTELVVLSACETGLGEIRGSEGVYGLQRSFKMAGAKYLLMSLWQVPDKETAEYMEFFYQKLFETNDIEGSYQSTQNYMKSKYLNEPYKWGAFVLVR